MQVDKEKKTGKQRNWMKKKKKKGKEIDVDEIRVQVYMNIFVYFGKRTFWWAGRKQIPPHFFFHSFSQPNTH